MTVPELQLDAYQAVAVAAIVLLVGRFIARKVPALARYCIPDPVIGGIIFAVLNLAGYVSGIGCVTFDATFQKFFMTVFFCSVGFSACFRLLKKAGIQVFVFLAISVLLVCFQDVIGTALAGMFGLDPRLGLAMGSIPLVGGHGTSGSFGPTLEEAGVFGANAVAIASATFGLVSGSLLGGPIARLRIEQKGLHSTDSGLTKKAGEEEVMNPINKENFLNAALYLAVSIGVGTLLYNFFMSVKFTVPTYIGAMLIAALIRNVTDGMKIEMPLEEIDSLGSLSLSLFLGLALMGLKLWQLAELAVPMIVILLVQTVFMAVYTYFVTFNVMGRDYEAACFSAAMCGFGMGATPNAMANIQAVNKKYGPSPRALFAVPLVGSLFIDFLNAAIITGFMNFLKP